MSLSELLYGIAFALFMIGAGWSFRSDGRPAAVALLAFGAAMDFTVTGLVSFGPEIFSFGITGSNFAIGLGVVLGVAVWLLVVTALVTWFRQRRRAFHVLVMLAQLTWFVDYLAFLYGIHAYPLS
jgi:hypothetical protein